MPVDGRLTKGEIKIKKSFRVAGTDRLEWPYSARANPGERVTVAESRVRASVVSLAFGLML